MKLLFNATSTNLSPLACSILNKLKFEFTSNQTQLLTQNASVTTTRSIISAITLTQQQHQSAALVSLAQMDHWLDFAHSISLPLDYSAMMAKFSQITSHLMLNSFLVGNSVTCADMYLWGSLKSSPLFLKMLKLKTLDVALERWYTYIKNLECVEKASQLVSEELEKLKVVISITIG